MHAQAADHREQRFTAELIFQNRFVRWRVVRGSTAPSSTCCPNGSKLEKQQVETNKAVQENTNDNAQRAEFEVIIHFTTSS